MFTHLLSTIWFLVICFVGGLAILVKGADWLVDGASDLAKRLGVSDLMIGLTVVAFGTSMPEFIVNMTSVSTHSTDLAITNVLGSNIINTLVILGCSALVFPIVAKKETVRIELPLTIIAGIMTQIRNSGRGLGCGFFFILKEHHFCDFPYFCTRIRRACR